MRPGQRLASSTLVVVVVVNSELEASKPRAVRLAEWGRGKAGKKRTGSRRVARPLHICASAERSELYPVGTR